MRILQSTKHENKHKQNKDSDVQENANTADIDGRRL